MLEFLLVPFARYSQLKGMFCDMCNEENRLTAHQKTIVITMASDGQITSYEEEPQTPKSNLAVHPFYYYCPADLARIAQAVDGGCEYDAPGSFAVWLRGKERMHAWLVPWKRYNIGELKRYGTVRESNLRPKER